MKRSTLKVLVLFFVVLLGVLGIYAINKKSYLSVYPENPINEDILQLISDMRNDDVVWHGTSIGIWPSEVTGATLLLQNIQANITPLLIDELENQDKYVAAHVLLTFRTSTSFPARRGEWNGLKIQLFSDGSVTFEGNDLIQLQEYWREKLQQ